MGAAIASVPQVSQKALQACAPLMYTELCSNSGIPVNIEKAAKCPPSTSTMKRILADTANYRVCIGLRCIRKHKQGSRKRHKPFADEV